MTAVKVMAEEKAEQVFAVAAVVAVTAAVNEEMTAGLETVAVSEETELKFAAVAANAYAVA